MAEHIVSGGGNALNAFLNSSSYKAGDTIWVQPGVYSSLLFANTIAGGGTLVKSTDGKESTIIDGQGISACLRRNVTNNGHIITFDGFSLSNGYVSTDVSADNLVPGYFMEAGGFGACRFLNCGFYDCSAFTLSANINGRLGIAYTNTTPQYPSYTYFKNCELSGNVSNTNSMFNGLFFNCDIHHNQYYKSQQGDRFAATGTFYACRIHHNEMSGIWGGASYADCLIYRNHGNNNWFNERSRATNCTFANNDGILHLDNHFGSRTWYKNCAFYKNFRKDGVTRSSANWGSNSRGTININNYFDQLSTTMTWYTPMTSTLVSGDAFLPGVNFGFVDEENDDYHLRPDSILISAGTNYRMSDFEMLIANDKNQLTALERYVDLFGNTDFDGKPFDEEHPSVGAYQFAVEKSNLPNKVYPFGTKEEKEWPPLYDSEIEYLESTGMQYIDTLYNVNTDTDEIHVSFRLMEDTAYKWCFGEYDSGKQFGIGRTTSTNAYLAYVSTTTIPASLISDSRCEFVADSTGVKINGENKATFSSFSSTSNIILFSLRRTSYSDTNNASVTRIYSYKHWRQGVLIRDFIPVRLGTTGYLYDRVSGQLFGNAGTGNFVLGPDVQS